jgi:glycosyltransferase involved in cell wall biosynthesis
MKIIFLSKFYPRVKRDEYLKKSKVGLASAADAHQYSLALGLNSVCEDLKIVNLPAIYPYPFRFKSLFLKTETIFENNLRIKNIGSCNLQFVQPLSQYYNLKYELKRIIENTNEIVYLLVYATAPYSLRCATELRKEYKNVRISVIIPDLPEYMDNDLPKLRYFIRLFMTVFFKPFSEYISQFDSYVLLTKYMQEKIKCADEKFIVIEGVYDESTTPRKIQQESVDVFRIFYSGMLNNQYGVMNLVDAVCNMSDNNLELVLCGFGDCVEKIKRISKLDSRIIYLGIVSRDIALDWQTKSSLLVNPRMPDNNPFTRYSFPSKILEYLSSGIPTLMYKLDGIPDEYYDYCYSLDKNQSDVFSLKEKLSEIMLIPQEERYKLGMKARSFILQNKNAHNAGLKIINLLKSTL